MRRVGGLYGRDGLRTPGGEFVVWPAPRGNGSPLLSADGLGDGSRRAVTSVSAFFPCYDDAPTIDAVVRRVAESLADLRIDAQIVVVNDGSHDESARVLEDLARAEPRLTVVTHEHNRGYGAALRSGFSAASRQWVFYTDGDGQYDPGELALLVEHASDDVDVVQGYKLNRSDSLARRVIGLLYHRVVAALFGLRVRDTDCDFRLIRRSTLAAVTLEKNSGAICVELVRRLQDAGARFTEVAVHHYPRAHGSSTFFNPANIMRTFRDLWTLWCKLVLRPRLLAFRRPLTAATSAVALFAVTWATSLRVPTVRSDEAWFLWVAHRANSGTALYRGVYYVSTPLAMWITQIAVWAFGAHVAVERGVASACFVISLMMIWFLGARVGLNRLGRALLLAAVFVYGSPLAHFGSVYSRLAVTLSLGALVVLLRVLDEFDARCQPTLGTFAVGALCGAAFDAKPNTGVFAFAAIALTLIMAVRTRTDSRQELARVLSCATAGFVAAIGVMLLPIIFTHSTGQFVGDVFTGKGAAYLAIESRGLFSGTFNFFTHVGSPLGELVLRSVSIVPCVSLVLVVIGLRRAHQQRSVTHFAMVAFAIAGLAAAAPDFAPQHVTEEIPLILALPLLAFTLPRATAKRRIPSALRVTLVAAGAVALALGIASSAAWAHRPSLRPPDQVAMSDVPHFTDTMVSATSETRVRADLNELREHTHGTVFLALLNAGYYYLAGGLHDPTPYDYPGRSDLGAQGESGVVRTLQHRHVQWVCLRHSISKRQSYSPIEPRHLESYVRHAFHFVERLNACDLYRSRGGPRHRQTTLATGHALPGANA